MDKQLKIEFVEVPLDHILRHYVDGFETKGKIISSEWFVDTSKNKVVFKMYIDGNDKQAQGDSS